MKKLMLIIMAIIVLVSQALSLISAPAGRSSGGSRMGGGGRSMGASRSFGGSASMSRSMSASRPMSTMGSRSMGASRSISTAPRSMSVSRGNIGTSRGTVIRSTSPVRSTTATRAVSPTRSISTAKSITPRSTTTGTSIRKTGTTATGTRGATTAGRRPTAAVDTRAKTAGSKTAQGKIAPSKGTSTKAPGKLGQAQQKTMKQQVAGKGLTGKQAGALKPQKTASLGKINQKQASNLAQKGAKQPQFGKLGKEGQNTANLGKKGWDKNKFGGGKVNPKNFKDKNWFNKHDHWVGHRGSWGWWWPWFGLGLGSLFFWGWPIWWSWWPRTDIVTTVAYVDDYGVQQVEEVAAWEIANQTTGNITVSTSFGDTVIASGDTQLVGKPADQRAVISSDVTDDTETIATGSPYVIVGIENDDLRIETDQGVTDFDADEFEEEIAGG